MEHTVTESAFILTDRLLTDLDQLILSPSTTGQRDELAGTATRIAAMMRARGLQVDVLRSTGAPIVVGRRSGRSPFTLLIYHRYDTAPTGRWRAWNHEPFQLAERHGVLYGRGVADGKGPLVAHLNALSALTDAEGELPCGVVVVAEGEGLAGSPSLAAALETNRAMLRADACLATGGDRDRHGLPLCYSGSKGWLQLRLRVGGSTTPLLAGYAATVANPLWRLVWALGQIKSDQEEILIGGFYDSIDGPSRAESKALRAGSVDEAARAAAWQISGFLFQMTGAALVQSEATLPTINLTAIEAEPLADPASIPAAAVARLDFQLVPRQQPHEIAKLLRAHLDDKGLADVTIEPIVGGYPASSAVLDHPFLASVSRAGVAVHGTALTILPRGPNAQPLALFGDIPAMSVGCARPDSGIVGPNERIPLPDLVRHGQLLIEVLYTCGS